jgi:CRISPR-associated endonuclease/helicase Cas3
MSDKTIEPPYAHSPNEGDDWSAAHLLLDHLQAVAALARAAAEPSGIGPWAEVSGLGHDLGKARARFQKYLHGAGPSVSHKLAGARMFLTEQHARGLEGKAVAMVIAGHHGGLHASVDLNALVESARDELEEARRSGLTLGSLALQPRGIPPELAEKIRASPEHREAIVELLIRFLFSALVDADYRDTAAYVDPAAERERADALKSQSPLPALLDRLEGHLESLAALGDRGQVWRLRQEVLGACRSSAASAPGMFDLTVPTGGGKTLSAMAFALRHAVSHGLRRVVVVVPFTTVVEQTARVYASIFGPENVLEHHSAFDGDGERFRDLCRAADLQANVVARRVKLLAENWNVPIVVTTSVQFLESLHSREPSRCRKLHNLARSVVVLDEVQTLPPDLLRITLETLRVVHKLFGVSFVCCTATQPALGPRRDAQGRLHVNLGVLTPIVPEAHRLFAGLSRVKVDWSRYEAGPIRWPVLAKELRALHQVLAILHRRRHAFELAREVGSDALHLSALMLPDHRRAILDEVRRRLRDGLPCCLVATQLVEAGVDIDFPVVYRAFAGLDALAQSAGRCNREGRLGPGGGSLRIFMAPDPPPPGILALAAQVATGLSNAGDRNLEDPALFQRFYERLYDSTDLDRRGLCGHRTQLDFPALSRGYKLIDDSEQVAVAVRWDGLAHPILDAIDRLRQGFADQVSFRRVRQASVTIPRRTALEWLAAGILVPAPEYGVPILDCRVSPERYDSCYGLLLWDSTEPRIDELIA